MTDKTKEELIKEIKSLQRRITLLEKFLSERNDLDEKVIRRSVELAKTAVDLKEEISERKKAQELQKRLVSILEAAPDFIGFADAKDNHIVYINRAGRKMLGIGEDEDVAKLKIADVHPQWMSKMVLEEIIPILMRDGTWKGEGAFQNMRDGHEIPVSMVISAHKGADKEIEIISTISRDITEGKKIQEALKESERKIRALYDQTFQFIGLMTPDGILIEANRTALEFSGIELADVLNKPFWQTPWWAHSLQLQEELQEAVKKVAQGEFFRFEATHRAKDGTLHYVDFSLKPVKDEKGKVIFMIPEGRDITEHKKAEEALRESYAKLKAMHDQFIQRDFPAVSGLNLNAEKIDSILETSLTLTKARLRFKNIDTKIEIKKDTPRALADKNKLGQVFVTILLNAVEAMPGGGRIVIRCFEKKFKEIKEGIGRRDKDNFRLGEKGLIIEIEDTGTGISEENLKRIFDPFFTTKSQKDHSLGLYVAGNIVHMHKGLIYAESKLGQGTTMTVILKIAET